MTIREHLIAAKAVIDKPQKWCKGNYVSPNGHRHCAIGAIHRANDRRPVLVSDETPVVHAVQRAAGADNLADFNDSHTHAEVMAAFDKAIEAA